MSDEYHSLRSELEALQLRFQGLANRRPNLHHQVCYCAHEQLPARTWQAFIRHFGVSSDGEWQEWQLLYDGRWCGRYFGAASLKSDFESLATEAVEILDRLSKIAGAGERFVVKLPPPPAVAAWLCLLHDAADLCGQPEIDSDYWGVSDEHHAPCSFAAYWSRPDNDLVSFPLHPTCVTFDRNLFAASNQLLDFILNPPIPLSEYRYLVPHEDFYYVPPYLPADPSIEAGTETVSGDEIDVIGQPVLGGLEVGRGAVDERPSWDRMTSTLRVGDRIVKEFIQDAPNQIAILDMLEEKRWPNPCEGNPFKNSIGNPIRETLSQTLFDLNKDQKEAAIKFFSRRGGVRWRIVSTPPRSATP